MPRRVSTDRLASLASAILGGLVKIKEIDGPLTATDRARLKAARALIRTFKAKK